jgi:hypothetical protein
MFVRFETTATVRREINEQARVRVEKVRGRGVEGRKGLLRGEDRRRLSTRTKYVAVLGLVLLAFMAQTPRAGATGPDRAWQGCEVGRYGESCLTVGEGYDPNLDWDMQYWVDLWSWSTHDDGVSAVEVDRAMQVAMLYRMSREIAASTSNADADTQAYYARANAHLSLESSDANQARVHLFYQLEMLAWWANLVPFLALDLR